eukprot:TRINITY_DN45025_c0_g1_i1.p1 TRINITY_DN45025_c0_g1~~TRINITY_DN45025_c0_g1_i1.p1  ORF type:complete len:114 (+),score=9.03 TRINITY_DN45025_c0_g1_i1:280-621(+)
MLPTAAYLPTWKRYFRPPALATTFLGQEQMPCGCLCRSANHGDMFSVFTQNRGTHPADTKVLLFHVTRVLNDTPTWVGSLLEKLGSLYEKYFSGRPCEQKKRETSNNDQANTT